MIIPLRVVTMIELELEKAAVSHPNYPADPVRRAAIVGEEAGEVLAAALDLTRAPGAAFPPNANLRMELVHVASTAIRALIAMEDE